MLLKHLQSGFKTTAAKNKEVANAKIATDKTLITNYGNQTISGTPDKIANGAVTKAELESLSGLNQLPILTQNVRRTYNISTNANGIATVTVTFSATDGDDATKTFTISGFKTTAAKNKEVANAKIATDKTLITNYGNQTISGTPDQIANGAVTKAELELLSGLNQLPILTQNVRRTYNISTNANGIATVTVTFSATDGDDATKTFTISGFKTTAAKNKEVANAKIATDKTLITNYGNQTISGTPDQIANGAVTKAELESLSGLNQLPILTQNVRRTYNISTNANGIATVTVTFSATDGDDATKTFTISGFKTTAAKNKEVANAKIATDKTLITNYGNQTISGTPDQIANGAVTKAELESLSGLNQLPILTQNVRRTYNISTNANGIATVTVTFSATDGDDATKTFTISGFKTTAAKNKEVANAKIATDKTLITNYGNQTISGTPDQIANGAVTKAELESLNGLNQLPILTQNVRRTYNISTNANGIATVTVTFSATNGDDATKTFTISGFKTTAAKNKEVANAKIATDKTLITNYGNQTISGTPDQIANGAVTKAELESLNGLNQLPILTQNVRRTYNISTNANGIATVTVTFSATDGDDATKTFTISGFKTTAAKNKEVANAKIATDKTLITNYGNQTISGTPDQIANGAVTKAELESLSGLNQLPILTQNVRRTYNISTNANGIATVTVTFSATDGDDATKTFTISGFKTTAAKNKEVANAKIATDKTLITNYGNQTISGTPDQIANGAVTKAELESLSGLNQLPILTQNVRRTYNISTNANGIATVTVTFSATDGDDATKTFTISGFKTTAAKNKEVANAKIATDKTLITNYGNQTISGTPDQIANGAVTKAELESLSGLNQLPILTQNVRRTYNISTNANGIATVTVTFSATDGDDATKTFTISGFKTTAAKNKEVANAKIATDKTLITNYGNQTISGTPDQIANGAVTKAELESLSGLNQLPILTQNVRRTYNISTNANGIATVTVTFSATDGDDATKTFTISGFRTIVSENIQKELNKIWVLDGEVLSSLRGEEIYKAFGKDKIIHDEDIIKNKLGITISNQKRIKSILKLLDTDDIEFRLCSFSKSVKNNIKIPMKDEKDKIVSYDFNYRYPNIFGFLEVRKKSSNNDWNRIYNSFDWNQKRFASIKIDDFKIDNLTKDNFFDESNLSKLVSRWNHSKDSWREIKKDGKTIKIEVLSFSGYSAYNPKPEQWHQVLIKKYMEIANIYNTALSYKAVSDLHLGSREVGTYMTFFKKNNKLYGSFLMKVSRKGIETGDFEYLYQNIYFEIV